MPSADPVLAAEREHLVQAREFLRQMREDVLSLRALGGDPVSEEYLKADLYRRAALTVLPATSQSLPGALATACAAAQQAAGSTAVIVADDQVAALSGQLGAAQLAHRVLDGRHPDPGDGGLLVVPVTLAKGLEFDHVIVVEPARIVAAEPRGLHRLYVALTRAVSRLTVLHSEPLPAALG